MSSLPDNSETSSNSHAADVATEEETQAEKQQRWAKARAALKKRQRERAATLPPKRDHYITRSQRNRLLKEYFLDSIRCSDHLVLGFSKPGQVLIFDSETLEAAAIVQDTDYAAKLIRSIDRHQPVTAELILEIGNRLNLSILDLGGCAS